MVATEAAKIDDQVPTGSLKDVAEDRVIFHGTYRSRKKKPYGTTHGLSRKPTGLECSKRGKPCWRGLSNCCYGNGDCTEIGFLTYKCV